MVLGKGTKRTSTTRKRTGAKRPARLTASRTTYRSNKRYAQRSNGVTETKIVPLTLVDEATPVAIQAATGANRCYTTSFTVGNVPGTWSGTTGLVPIGGMSFPLGTGHANRNGKYIYLLKTHLSMIIDMDNTTNFQFPCEFRMIVFKARRSNSPVGISRRFDQSLFLAPNGNTFGHATAGTLPTDIMLQPINKKDWVVYQDKKFQLSNPAVVSTTNIMGSTGKYPVTKTMSMNLPYFGKAEIDGSSNAPIDMDYHYVVALYARLNGQDDLPSKWEVSLRGSTTYKDN